MVDKAIKVIVHGRVQGIGYRNWATTNAEAIGVDGFVRNVRRDATVEMLLSGEEALVDAMLKLCHKGPPGARVLKVEVTPAQGIVDKGFKQLATV